MTSGRGFGGRRGRPGDFANVPHLSPAQETVEKFSALVKGREQAASAAMVRAYAPVYTSLQAETSALMKEFLDKPEGLAEWKKYRMNRLTALDKQFQANVAAFADNAADLVTDAQRTAVGLAHRGAQATANAGLPAGITPQNMANLNLGWNEFPEDALEAFVGISAKGAPVGELFAGMGEEAAEKIKGTINSGIVMGKSPRVIARQVRTAAGMPLSRSLTIARTETLRAYREATRLEYTNNSQVVKGYRRVATRDDVTCVACFALDGDLYQLSEPFDGHPNCRCAMVPEVLDYKDLGVTLMPEGRPENARDWLTRQSPTLQRKVLGNSRFNAWKEGAIQLGQLATRTQTFTWGATQRVATLQELGIAGRRSIGKSSLEMPVVTIKGKQAIDLDTSDSVYRRPTGPLKDPKTGEPVRGSLTTPPDPEVDLELATMFVRHKGIKDRSISSAEWATDGKIKVTADMLDPTNANYLGATYIRNELLDAEPLDLTTSLANAPEGWLRLRDELHKLVQEQEAWGRAIYGADEVIYTGFSPLQARAYNQALADVVAKNNWRPLRSISTVLDPNDPVLIREGFTSWAKHQGTYAAQWSDNIVLNPRMATTKIHMDTKIATNARHNAAYVTGLEKGSEERKRVTSVKKWRNKMAKATQEWEAHQETSREIGRRYGDMSGIKLRERLAHIKDELAKVESRMLQGQATQWSVPIPGHLQGAYSTLVHELGHYGHRRYGINGPQTKKALGGRRRGVTNRWGQVKFEPDDGVQDHASKLSAYACSHEKEYFAEAFVDYFINGGTNLTPEVKTFVETVVEWNRLSGAIANHANFRGVVDPMNMPVVIAVGGRGYSLRRLAKFITPMRLSKAYDLKSLVPGGGSPRGREAVSESESERQRQGVME